MSLDTTRLMNNARLQVPGATDDNIKLELFNTLHEFFQDSSVWLERIPFTVKSTDDPATTTYYVEAESVSTIIRLYDLTNSAGRSVGATMEVPGEIILNQQPGQDDTYTAVMVLSINDPVAKDGFPEFPQWILDKYGLGILDGVIARLMSQPAKPYTNVQLATYHKRVFRATVGQAANDAVRKNLANAQAWRFPQSFAVRRR